MHLDRGHRTQEIVADAPSLRAPGNHDRAIVAEAAGLEAVEGVDQIIILARLERLFLEQVTRQCLRIGCDLRSALDGARRVHDAELDRAVFRFRADIPVKILHALDDAGGDHLAIVGCEFIPAQHERRTPAERKGEDRVEARRLEPGFKPLHEGRGRRQGDQVRNVATERVQQPECLVRAGTADMHMLAENGELLGQIPVKLRDVMETRRVEDGLLPPVLERMRPTAGEQDTEAIGLMRQHVADIAQLRQGVGMAHADIGG